MAPVKVSWLVAERYMLLGSVGFSIFIVLCFQKLEKHFKKIALILFSLLIIAYSVRIILRNIDWQTNHNLWVNTCQVSPNSHNAWNNIGDDYDKLDDYDDAVKGFGMSFAVKPNYADAYHNQANIFYKMGRLDLARQNYETTIAYNPNLYQTYLTLIQLDLIENKKDELLKHLAQYNQAKPGDLEAAYITATSYAKIGMIDEAKKLADLMYQQFPDINEIKNLYFTLNNVEATSSSVLNN